jgi:hypothetical protein
MKVSFRYFAYLTGPNIIPACQRAGCPARVICVDGVGFSTIGKMRAKGRFKSFHPPSRMISPDRSRAMDL